MTRLATAEMDFSPFQKGDWLDYLVTTVMFAGVIGLLVVVVRYGC